MTKTKIEYNKDDRSWLKDDHFVFAIDHINLDWNNEDIIISLSTQRKLYKDCLMKQFNVEFSSKRICLTYISSDSDYLDYFIIKHRMKIKVSDIPKFITILRKRMKEHEVVKIFKVMKACKAQSRKKEWETVLPDRVALWASRRLQSLQKEYGDSCTDNYRVARVGNTCQERRYRRQVKDGCCGFFDCIEVCPHDGLSYRLGFNYGH